MQEEVTEGVSGCTYWRLEGDVSNGFNRMKAKVFNLIEAVITDKEQAKALKGLVKGFANDEYGIVIENMRYDARQMKLIPDGAESNILPLGSEPLEHALN